MNRISPVVKNLLIINILFFVATYLAGEYFSPESSYWITNPLIKYLALFYPESDFFQPYQFITHMFMHGGFPHILFNMYALWMFGTAIENAWGGKRFLFYYLFTGIGAAALHTLVNYIILSGIAADIPASGSLLTPELFKHFIDAHRDGFNQTFINQLIEIYQGWSMQPDDMAYAKNALAGMNHMLAAMQNIPTVGASGAVFGLLLAFGMMYPNARLMFIFFPVPIRAKWMVIGYGAIELFLGISQPGSSIAHFAHIGGMLFGFILIWYWKQQAKKNQDNFYY
jgi:membrane associated rhomboid family serine protease